MIKREVVDFGHTKVAFVTQVLGDRVAVSWCVLARALVEPEWTKLERQLSFAAPEAE